MVITPRTTCSICKSSSFRLTITCAYEPQVTVFYEDYALNIYNFSVYVKRKPKSVARSDGHAELVTARLTHVSLNRTRAEFCQRCALGLCPGFSSGGFGVHGHSGH